MRFGHQPEQRPEYRAEPAGQTARQGKPERAPPAQEVLPPNPELEAAISQWSQSSEGSVLIERLYDAEQGSQLTTVFDRLDIVEDVRGQVQEQLRELYRLGFDHPDAYEQESQRIWGNLSNLLGEDTRTRLEQEIYSAIPTACWRSRVAWRSTASCWHRPSANL